MTAVEVWIELTGSSMDGMVLAVEADDDDDDGAPQPIHAHRYENGTVTETRLVSTGTVRWRGETPIEVYVPEDLLPLWRAEHDVE